MSKTIINTLDVDRSRGGQRTVVPLPALAPERLVGVGFRCWLNGLSTGDIENWTAAWDTYSGVLGSDHAKSLLIDLSVFVRAVSANSKRPINVMGRDCASFCQDECLAISMIAASQHGARETLSDTAMALLGSDDIGDTLAGAQRLAGGLAQRQQRLSVDSVCPASCALQMMKKAMRSTTH